jgi:hypothetical protein
VDGEMQKIIRHLFWELFKDFSNNLVKLESRYGMWVFSYGAESLLITLDNWNSDLFILAV